jgi:hypothetical protein
VLASTILDVWLSLTRDARLPITQRMVLSNARGALNVRDARLAISLRGFAI